VNRNYRSIIVCILVGLLLQTCIRDEVLAPPVISTLTKSSWISGDVFPVNGANFDPTSTKVFIDGDEASLAGSVTTTVVNVIVPMTTSTREATLFVRTKFGTSSTIEFTIHPPLPNISKVIPDKAGAGRKIKVQGSNFESVTGVSFKSGSNAAVSASFIKIATDTLEVTVPAAAGVDACDIFLNTTEGTSSPASFTILHAPVIDSFTPGSGVSGAVVQVNGQYLAPLLTIHVGSQKLEVISGSPNAVVARIGANVISDTIKISTWGGDAKAATKFTISPAPVITTLDKTSGIAGTEITITGQFLTGAFDVRFGDITTDIISNTGTVMKVKVPPGAATGKISITSVAGTGISPMDFVVPAGPIVSDFTPTTGVAGTKVTVNGLNFGAASVTPHSINIGSMALTNVVWTDTKIEGNIPAGAVTGKIIINTPNGTFETGSNFLISGSVQILSFSPANGVAGTTVTITGINMGTTPDVRFNNVKSTVITKATPTEIICTVPVGASTGKISVNSALSATNFTIAAAPVIKSIMPSRGPVNAEVTIAGEFLSGATVRFANNVVATKVGSDTDIQLKVKVPATAVTGKITVTNTIGTATSSSNFEVLAAPTITSFTPTSGVVGSQVTVNGTNLQYNGVIRFGSIVASVRFAGATQLIVDVPAGATDGKISVSTDGTLTPVVSVANFDVINAPVITSIAPASATAGATVAINGTDLGNLQSVTFDANVLTTFVSKTATKIEFVVPTIANNYTHSVNVNAKTSVGTSANVTFTYVGPPTIPYAWPDTNPLGWAVLLSGSNLSSVQKIVINGAIAPIDYKSDGAVTTRVPANAGIGPGAIKVYYTTENFLSVNFTVMAAPPPGVFPPPLIVIPPPPPGGFVPVNVNADWADAYESTHWYRIDADPASVNPNGTYKSSGSFTIVEHYDGEDDELKALIDGRQGTGTWAGAIIRFRLGGDNYSGVYNQGFQLVFTNSNTGHQIVLGTACPNFPACK